jgi:cysteinyl-tRNA synthetase
MEHGIPSNVWEMVVNASKVEAEEDTPPSEVLALLEERQDARTRKDFAASDRLRDQISASGWTVQDSKEGQKLVKKEK